MKRQFGLQDAFNDRALEFFPNRFEQVPTIDSFELPQLRQPRRERERIARKRPGLINPTIRRKLVHNLGPPPKRPNRQSAPDYFTKGGQVWTHSGETPHAAASDTKTRHDLVEN